MISLAGPSFVGGGQNGFDFLRAEKADQTVGVPLEWDARDPGDRRGEVRAQPVAQIMDKGANGRQTCIPCPDAIAALPLQVLKKANHGIRGKNVERQREAGPGVTFPEVLESLPSNPSRRGSSLRLPHSATLMRIGRERWRSHVAPWELSGENYSRTCVVVLDPGLVAAAAGALALVVAQLWQALG